MFQVEVRWNVKQLGPVLNSVAADVAKNIQARSRADIANSGLSKPGRFVKGLTTRVRPVRKGQVVQVFLTPNFAHVWEYGGTSVGKPLLWIAQPGVPRRIRNYGGKLFRPPGTNVLMSRPSRTKITGVVGSGQTKPKVMYVGVPSVTNARRFHLRQIAQEEAQKVANIILKNMR